MLMNISLFAFSCAEFEFLANRTYWNIPIKLPALQHFIPGNQEARAFSLNKWFDEGERDNERNMEELPFQVK